MMLSYKKGEGWVYGPAVPTMEVTAACGTRLRIEMRRPEIGERFRSYTRDYAPLKNGLPDEVWLVYFRNEDYLDYPICGTGYHTSDVVYATVVPVG